MKIGFSFGQCVRSLVKGEVSYDDVVVIISRTNITKEEHISRDSLYDYFHRNDYWGGLDGDACIEMGRRLLREGKIHQPRQFGNLYNSPVNPKFTWMDLAPTIQSDHPSVVEAYKRFQMLQKLSAEGKLDTVDDAAKAVAPYSRRAAEAIATDEVEPPTPVLDDNF